jgi:hypothetical protein
MSERKINYTRYLNRDVVIFGLGDKLFAAGRLVSENCADIILSELPGGIVSADGSGINHVSKGMRIKLAKRR